VKDGGLQMDDGRWEVTRCMTPRRQFAGFWMRPRPNNPAPGGGSVTALAGALAVSMGEMVLNYSIGKKDLAPHAAELQAALAEFGRARAMLLELMSRIRRRMRR